MADKGFMDGEHYWELIAPADCYGMQMGVIEERSTTKETPQMIAFGFRTTTPRVIGIA